MVNGKVRVAVNCLGLLCKLPMTMGIAKLRLETALKQTSKKRGMSYENKLSDGAKVYCE
jgi:hypothetical protein